MKLINFQIEKLFIMSENERFKNFTILHSNDIHGDFLAEVQSGEGNLIGGLALISGYLNQVRKEEKNVLYLIAGDMLQGSIIDSEYKGISTIEIMNYLAPDVVTLGNHEFEYGLPHLLFLEKLANFPIVSANLYISKYNRRLMNPYKIINVDGFDIMFIGIITDEVLKALKHESEVGSFISLHDAAQEVGRICDAYKDQDIDLTVLLTHIGFEEDKKLAALLNPEWGVDLIIGGHSHTVLSEPAIINNILIAQAGIGSDHIGRFDIVVDDDTNSIVEWKWKLLEVNENLAKPDADLQEFINSFKVELDRKYNTPICHFSHAITHPAMNCETELGNLFADVFQQRSQCDIAFFASFAIRGNKMGPIVTLGNFTESIPYDDALLRFTLTGEDLYTVWEHILRPENQAGEGYFFQLSKHSKVLYNNSARKIESFTLLNLPIEKDKEYTICTQKYHYEDNTLKHFGLAKERFTAIEPSQVVVTSMKSLLEEFLRTHQHLKSAVEGRIVFK